MLGGHGKMGRGGRVAGKRIFHSSAINRAVRPSTGSGPRARGWAPPATISSTYTSSMQVEESFSLVRENPLYFGMAIKLAPDLVEDIKRAEVNGGVVRIKFDANANNPNDNVIHVGDKIFRFTWSREPGDLCDIYEERQSGVDGNELLVEAGGTWRKLNVERELDESTKNHVKRMSEEAERKHKSRKAIVLNHQSPSMKNQVKALGAAESNPWRNFKNQKEPPSRKAKLDLPSEQGRPASPAGRGNLVEGLVDITDSAPSQKLVKEVSSKFPNNVTRDKSKHSRNTRAKPADLRNLVISLLKENHSKGMSLKALEKAIGEVMPSSARQIDPILKQVAVFQSPGRYLLKQGPEKESMKKLSFQSGSFPASNCPQPSSPQITDQLLSLDPPILPMTTSINDEQKHGEPKYTTHSHSRNTDDPTDKADKVLLASQLSDSKAPASSSLSNSSDSGSSSPSHSCSDSESNYASTSSKQASDENVEITSDEELPKLAPASPHPENERDNINTQDTESVSPKRFMSRNMSLPTISPLLGDNTENPSPDRLAQIPEMRSVDIMADIINVDNVDNDEPSRGSLEARGEVSLVQKGLNMDDSLVGERMPAKFSLECIVGNENTSVAESNRKKPVMLGEKDVRPQHRENVSGVADRLPMANGHGSVLQREYPNLELGEFLEPIENITPLPKKQIERKNSFNQMENMFMDSECRKSDPGKGKPPICKINADSGVKFRDSELEICGSANGRFKRKAMEKNDDDLMKPHKKSSRHLEENPQGLGDHMEPGPQHTRVLEMGNKSRFADRPSQASSLEAHRDVSRRMPVNSTELQQHDTVHGVGIVSTKVSNKHKANVMSDSNRRRVDASLTGTVTNESVQEEEKNSSDEDILYAKYEKQEPELKDPIKDASQYNEYVSEYQEKYENYCTLNKTLEEYRTEFTKYGKDLESYKDRDMTRYHEALKQIRSSFHQRGENHKRQKKTFIVLHEELKHLKQMIKDYVAAPM